MKYMLYLGRALVKNVNIGGFLMSILFYLLIWLFYIAENIVFCELIFKFERHIHKLKKLVGVSVFITCAYTCMYLNNYILKILLCTIVTYATMYMIYEKNIRIIIFSGTWMILLISMLDVISGILVETFVNLVGIKNECIMSLMTSIISMLFICIVGKIYSSKYQYDIIEIGIINIVLFTVLMVIDTFIVKILDMVMIDEAGGTRIKEHSIVLIVIIFTIFIQSAMAMLFFLQRNMYREKENITLRFLNMQKHYYEYLENREIDTKKFRHDLKNHMKILSNYAREEDYEGFNEYLEKINIKISNFGKLITIHNKVADAIISQYWEEAVERGINMSVKGMMPENCDIEPYDICTIFSNLLSNAIEASREAKKKNICISCRYDDKNIIIRVKNTFNNVGQFYDGEYKTNKKDKNNHGFGIKNIRDCIKKYNGYLNIQIENEEFVVTVFL